MKTIQIDGQAKWLKLLSEKAMNKIKWDNVWYEILDEQPYLFITEDGFKVEPRHWVYVVNSVFVKLRWSAQQFFDKNEAEYFKAFVSEKAADNYIKEFKPINLSMYEIRERVYLAHGKRDITQNIMNTIIELVNEKSTKTNADK